MAGNRGGGGSGGIACENDRKLSKSKRRGSAFHPGCRRSVRFGGDDWGVVMIGGW